MCMFADMTVLLFSPVLALHCPHCCCREVYGKHVFNLLDAIEFPALQSGKLWGGKWLAHLLSK